MTTEVEILIDGLACPEGPDQLPDGRIVFVETFARRVSAWDARGGLRTYAEVDGAPNACLVGSDGAVYVAQNGVTAGPWRSPAPVAPSIQRIWPDGRVELLVTTADGEPLVGPNDLTFGADGRLYFTDPGLFDADRPGDGQICVVEPDGTATVLVETGPSFPNGIVAEPDGSIVWNESFTRRVHRRRSDGAVELLATLPEDRIPDGMKIASDGRLYITGVSSGGIDVVAANGELLGFVDVQGVPLNCLFVGTELYVTDFGEWTPEAEQGHAVASGRLTRVRCGMSGMPLFRGAIDGDQPG